MIYAVQTDGDDRSFSGLHETLLPLAAVTRTIFQQLRGTKVKKSKRRKASVAGAAAPDAGLKINGSLIGRITGVDMRHLLLLLPFLLFDLLDDEISNHNTRSGADHSGPARVLISVVLALLEWYHLYRHAENSCVLCSITKYCVVILYNRWWQALVSRKNFKRSSPPGCAWKTVCADVRRRVSLPQGGQSAVPGLREDSLCSALCD